MTKDINKTLDQLSAVQDLLYRELTSQNPDPYKVSDFARAQKSIVETINMLQAGQNRTTLLD